LSEAAWPSGSQGSPASSADSADLELPPLRYVPGALLGRGGQASVRSGFDPLLERHVALKRAHRRDWHARELLLREARLTARLDHPAIAEVLDVGLEGDDVVVVLHVRHGRTLAEVMAGSQVAAEPGVLPSLERATGPSAPLRLVRALLQASEALAHAHRRGLVHRDLSPTNVTLGEAGEVTVLDWGLAAELEEAQQGGMVGGTPGYAAPEMRSGGPCSPATDVWSLGALLHLALTAEPPNAAVVRPSRCDKRLWAILGRALADQPAERYRDAGELAAELRAYLDGDAVAAYRENPLDRLLRQVRRHPAVSAAVAGGLAVSSLAMGVGGLWAARSERRASAAEEHARAARSARLVDAAERALAIDDALGAQSLASEAALGAEKLRAHGVLAAVARAIPLPLRAETPPCGADELLDADLARGLAVCRGQDGVALRGAAGVPPLPSSAISAAFMADATVWVGSNEPTRPELRRLRQGADGRWQVDIQPLGGGTPLLRTSPSRRHGVVFNAEGVGRVGRDRGPWLLPCDAGRAPRDVAVDDTGRTLVWCAGDELVSVAGDRVVARVAAAVMPVLRGVTRMDFISDREVAVGTSVGRVGVVEIATGAVISAQDTPVGFVRGLSASGVGKTPLVLVSGQRGAVAYQPRAERLIAVPHDDTPSAVLQGVRLASGPGDSGLRLARPADSANRAVWAVPGEPPAAFASSAGMHGRSVIATSSAPHQLAVGDGQGQVLWFDLATGRAQTVAGLPQVIKALAWSPEGRYLAIGAAGPDGLRVQDVQADRAVQGSWIGDLNVRVHQVQWLGKDLLIAFSYGGGPYAWRIRPGDASPVQLAPLPRPNPQAMADVQDMDAGATGVWIAYQGGLLARYELRGTAVQLVPLASVPGAKRLSVSPDGLRALAAVGEELLDLDTGGAVVRRLSRPGAIVEDIALAQDGRRAICRRDGTVTLETAGGQALWTVPAHTDRCASVAFCDGERAICSAGWDGRIRLIATAPR
jgi:tRNA A-37 threonylcarbamoyl transferase component Bud32